MKKCIKMGQEMLPSHFIVKTSLALTWVEADDHQTSTDCICLILGVQRLDLVSLQ